MIRPPRYFAQSTAVLLLSTAVLSTTVLSIAATTALAQYVPPDRGLPGRREGGGTRGDCVLSQPNLTALMPQQNFGRTVQAHPTFFWYVPQTSATTAEFELRDGNQTIYKQTIALPGRSGVLEFKLPEDGSAPALAIGKDYQWSFSIICRADDPSGNLLTQGWVQRQELTPEFAAKLEQVSPADRATVYAQAGIWYDALTTLADLRQQPGTPLGVGQGASLGERWTRLLRSVGLEALANQPFVAAPAQAAPIDTAPPQTAPVQGGTGAAPTTPTRDSQQS